MQNDCGAFQNFWVRAALRAAVALRLHARAGLHASADPPRRGQDLHPRPGGPGTIEARGCVACRYVDPATGEPAQAVPAQSQRLAERRSPGLCDPTGRVFGLMPHPEAYLYPGEPSSVERGATGPADGEGLKIFRNAVDSCAGL